MATCVADDEASTAVPSTTQCVTWCRIYSLQTKPWQDVSWMMIVYKSNLEVRMGMRFLVWLGIILDWELKLFLVSIIQMFPFNLMSTRHIAVDLTLQSASFAYILIC